MSAITYIARRGLIGAHIAGYTYNLEYGFSRLDPDDKDIAFHSKSLNGSRQSTAYRIEDKWKLTTVPLTDTPEGSNLIVTGDFASDTNWNKGTGWTIASGVATHAAGTGSLLSQVSVAIPAGRVSFNFLGNNISAGEVTPVITGLSSFDAVSSHVNNEQFLEVVSAASRTVSLSANAAFAGDVDNVDVRLAAGDFYYMKEFLRSIMYGETFTFDAYGTIASPDNAQVCELVPGSVSYQRLHPVSRTAVPTYAVSFDILVATT